VNVGNVTFQTSTSRVDVLQLNTCQQLRVVRASVVVYGELSNGGVEVLRICNELDRTQDRSLWDSTGKFSRL